MITEIIGNSLEDLFRCCKFKFTLLTTLMVVEQMLCLIEFIHSRNIIHRSVSPENFVMGRGNKKHQVYAFNFDIAKFYRHPKTGLHIPFTDFKGFRGTPLYASINAHLGIEQSRRDDIESLGYIFVYFMKGNLPWQGLRTKNIEEKLEIIKEKKITIGLETLCFGLPGEIKTFIQYARDLQFEDCPDYNYLKNLIRKIGENNHLVFNYNKFDWITKKERMKKKKKNSEENDN